MWGKDKMINHYKVILDIIDIKCNNAIKLQARKTE